MSSVSWTIMIFEFTKSFCLEKHDHLIYVFSTIYDFLLSDDVFFQYGEYNGKYACAVHSTPAPPGDLLIGGFSIGTLVCFVYVLWMCDMVYS